MPWALLLPQQYLDPALAAGAAFGETAAVSHSPGMHAICCSSHLAVTSMFLSLPKVLLLAMQVLL